METGQMSASQCSTYQCFILNRITLETNRLLYLIYPYIQYDYKKCPAPLSMQKYNYSYRRRHLMYINCPIFMRLTRIHLFPSATVLSIIFADFQLLWSDM